MRTSSILMAIVVALVWGAVSPIGRFLLALSDEVLTPFQLALSRYLLGFIFLLLVHFKGKKGKFPALKHYSNWKFLTGGTVLAIFSFILFLGLESTTASLGGVLLNSNSILIGIFAYIFLREKVSKNQVIGLTIGVLGVIVMMLPSIMGDGQGTFIGNFLSFLSGVIWAAYSILLTAWFSEKEHAIEVIMINLGIASVILSTYIALTSSLWVSLNLMQILLILILGVGSTGLGFTLYLILMNRENVVMAGSIQLAVPAVSILLGLAFFAEKIEIIEWLGIAFIAVAMYITIFLNGE